MITTQTVPTYAQVSSAYAEQLAAHGIGTAMLTHKWQPGDLISPHSDIDVRVILHQLPASWWDWNQSLALAHARTVAQDITHRRLLEHPPGFAFTTAELDQHRVSPPELATWSLVTGSTTALQRWKSHAQMAPWSRDDERFYRGILGARIGGRYQLEKDSADNVHSDLTGYRGHCVAWHYVAPCWFAAAALATGTRCPGKSAALVQWHPGELEVHAESFLRYGTEGLPPGHSPRDLLREAHGVVDAMLRRTPSPRQVDEHTGSDAVAWTMTAGLLRVRVARWLYYLDPPAGTATGYLIAREAKEIRAARETLNRIADGTSGREGRLAAAMAGLLPDGPTTAESLRALLDRWRRHEPVVEEFLTAQST
ncbi:hypothetical protein [Streptomyces blattellae]|uniref:hypothetical protein n=1 Tax=Streptomyces blattellae TaxID=2569855 RepID=UPI0012B998F8|nr:hypothetical protein [Streptomyces blattellae]